MEIQNNPIHGFSHLETRPAPKKSVESGTDEVRHRFLAAIKNKTAEWGYREQAPSGPGTVALGGMGVQVGNALKKVNQILSSSSLQDIQKPQSGMKRHLGNYVDRMA